MFSNEVYICERACDNQPSDYIKIDLFFQLCPFITPDPFEITTQIFADILFGTGDIHCYVTRCNFRSDG